MAGQEKRNNQNKNNEESTTFVSKETSYLSNPLDVQGQSLSTAEPITDVDMVSINSSMSGDDKPAGHTEELNKHLHVTIPFIEITPPVEKSVQLQDINLDLDIDASSPNADIRAIKSGYKNMNFLRVPQVDTTINIARPSYEDNLNASRMIDNSNDEDIEVICRFSSTPVLSPAKSGRNINDTDVSMLSINSASPIGPAESSTPAGSNNPSIILSQDISEEGKVLSSLDHQKYKNDLFDDSHMVPQQTQAREPSCALVPPHMPHTSVGNNSGGNEKPLYHCQDSIPAASYTACHSGSYFPCLQSGPGYNDYHIGRGASWTDLSYRTDLSTSTLSIPSMTDPCCFALGGGMASAGGCLSGASPDTDYFVYPSIYVSSAGLISVLLRNDISVEMTVDRTIRVVSHNHMMAVATDSRGTAACLYHPAVKVFQMGNTTDIATHNFRAQMGGNDCIVFSNGVNYFRLEGAELQPTAPMKFIDILRDQSVNLLFSSEGYGETLVASCMQVAAQAEYANLPKGGVIVRINGVKVTQTGGGDVTVVTGAKFIRLSPNSGTTRLGNRFVDIEVEKDWSVKLTRGSHSFVYTKKRAMICNGKMEAGFDENNGLKVNNLAPRHPLLADPTMVRRPTRKPVRAMPIPGSSVYCTPKRRAAPPTSFGGRWGAGGVGSL
ncbi:hypothetical protein ElyMa_004731600 [Elysia marginata]|uniref:Uncharacterized protein n=1 Tax=Elysia marginata TaxID=1093978 RepID=A0AAV4IAT5_9GAST|nr:hypothetical protein ElyMa_004731600 [Elysia marginata]